MNDKKNCFTFVRPRGQWLDVANVRIYCLTLHRNWHSRLPLYSRCI